MNTDLIIKEVPTPYDQYCASGHKAPIMFKRNGPNQPEEPTKFYHITSNTLNGVYCELCLIVANWHARNKGK